MAIFSHFNAPGGLEIGSTPVLIKFQNFYIPNFLLSETPILPT